ncbi:MAG TPA: DUF2752 domain-containing protein [Blastocatellia bacterium]|nr:DUF2752 domain-containing protein [Blastocatellia bacterium]
MNPTVLFDSFDVKVREAKRRLFSPVFAPLIESRVKAIIISGAVAIQCGLTALGVGGWQCPVLAVLGVPCPGCGLSRAVTALARGDWPASLNLHAFAPLFVIAFALIGAAALLPGRQRRSLLTKIEAAERRTGLTAILLIAFMIYWLLRLLLFPEAFIRLIKA